MEYVYSVASVTDFLFFMRIHHGLPHIFTTMKDVEEFTKANPLSMFRYYDIREHEVKNFKRCVNCKTNLLKETGC